MKTKIILKAFLLAAGAFGLTAAVCAGGDDPAPVPVTGPVGLLGQTYAGLTYSYIDLHTSPVNADSYGFQYDQSLNPGFDGVLTYDYMQTGVFAGSRLNQQTIGGALRAFSYALPWGKPYVEAGVGYTWTKSAGTRDNSIVWDVAVGAELQVCPAGTVTPFVQYQNAPDLHGGSTWNYGAKANYWMNSQWALTGAVVRDNDRNMTFTLGTNFRF